MCYVVDLSVSHSRDGNSTHATLGEGSVFSALPCHVPVYLLNSIGGRYQPLNTVLFLAIGTSKSLL